MKKVKDFMKKKVIYFKPEDSIFKVAKIFCQKNISGAPVVKNKKVVGVISESDIIKFMKLKLPEADTTSHEPHVLSLIILNFIKDHLEFKKELKRISKIKVKDLMNNLVLCISPDANLYEAATLMEKHDVNRLPVIKQDKLVGIITRMDLLKALIK